MKIAPVEAGRPEAQRPIGTLLRERCRLQDEEIERVAGYQRVSGLRFGEAAVALRLVQRKDVIAALAEQYQYPVGFVGRETIGELVAAADPFGEQADAFRELRTRLLELTAEAPRGALAVVSPEPGDGKTYLAANLGVAFSQLAERTLVIDADLRTPRQHALLGTANDTGLSSVLAGFVEPGAAIQAVPGLPNLFLLPAGPVPPNPLELVQRSAMRVLVRDSLHSFEHVLIDTAAAARGADARVVAAHCGASLVVGRRDRSRMAPLEGLIESLTRSRVKVAGVVLNEH